jgi:hypothetical protein
MPTLEFHGYSAEKSEQLLEKLRPGLAHLEYCADIVFSVDHTDGRTVTGWDGTPAPFIRILSRSNEKLAQLQAVALPHSDVETLQIGYAPRAGARDAPSAATA